MEGKWQSFGQFAPASKVSELSGQSTKASLEGAGKTFQI
jgi:hypothetical protein